MRFLKLSYKRSKLIYLGVLAVIELSDLYMLFTYYKFIQNKYDINAVWSESISLLRKGKSNFNYYGPTFFRFIYFLIFFIFTSPTLGLPYLLIWLNKLTSNRLPPIKLNLVSDSIVTQYNGLVVVFGWIVLFYFVTGCLYTLIKTLNKFKLNKSISYWFTSFSLLLKLILKYVMITILMFSLLFYYRYSIPIEFSNKATAIYQYLYNEPPIIANQWHGLFVDHFVYLFTLIATWILGYLRASYVTSGLKLIKFKITLKPFKLVESLDVSRFVKHIFVFLSLMVLIRLVSQTVLTNLLILPLRNDYVYDLDMLVHLNNYIRICLLSSVILIIISYLLINIIDDYQLNKTTYSKKLPFLLLIEDLVTNNEVIPVIKVYLKVINSLGHFALFSSALVQYVNHIPAGYITIGYQI